MPGPAKQSNATKKAKGSRKIHLGEDLAPPLLMAIPKPPAILSEIGREKWENICDLLISEEMLTAWDLSGLEALCLEFERYVEAVEDCRKNGEYFETANGYQTKRPVAVTRNQAFSNYTYLLKRFGGDVQARASMKRIRPQKEGKNPFGAI